MTASFEILDNTGSPTQPALSLPCSDGRDLRPLPLLDRKRLLADLLPEATGFHLVPHLEEHGEAVYARAVELSFEGVVASAYSPYRAGPDSPLVGRSRTRTSTERKR